MGGGSALRLRPKPANPGRERFAARIPDCSRGWPESLAIGVVNDNNELIGASVYHGWSPETGVIEMSSAAISPKWITRANLKVLFGQAFDGFNCRIVVMRVHPDNAAMRSIAKRLGSKEYVIDDLRAEGVPEIIYTLSKTAWRKFIGA